MNERTNPWRARRAWVVFALLGCGCAQDLARASSGAIGCPHESITVSEVSVGWGETAWRAQCRGVSFFCSGEAAAACTPELVAGTEPTPVADRPSGPPRPARLTEVSAVSPTTAETDAPHTPIFRTDSNEHEDEHPHD